MKIAQLAALFLIGVLLLTSCGSRAEAANAEAKKSAL